MQDDTSKYPGELVQSAKRLMERTGCAWETAIDVVLEVEEVKKHTTHAINDGKIYVITIPKRTQND